MITILKDGKNLDVKSDKSEYRYVKVLNGLLMDIDCASDRNDQLTALNSFVERAHKHEFGKKVFALSGVEDAFKLLIKQPILSKMEVVDFIQSIPWPGKGYITLANSNGEPLPFSSFFKLSNQKNINFSISPIKKAPDSFPLKGTPKKAEDRERTAKLDIYFKDYRNSSKPNVSSDTVLIIEGMAFEHQSGQELYGSGDEIINYYSQTLGVYLNIFKNINPYMKQFEIEEEKDIPSFITELDSIIKEEKEDTAQLQGAIQNKKYLAGIVVDYMNNIFNLFLHSPLRNEVLKLIEEKGLHDLLNTINDYSSQYQGFMNSYPSVDLDLNNFDENFFKIFFDNRKFFDEFLRDTLLPYFLTKIEENYYQFRGNENLTIEKLRSYFDAPEEKEGKEYADEISVNIKNLVMYQNIINIIRLNPEKNNFVFIVSIHHNKRIKALFDASEEPGLDLKVMYHTFKQETLVFGVPRPDFLWVSDRPLNLGGSPVKMPIKEAERKFEFSYMEDILTSEEFDISQRPELQHMRERVLQRLRSPLNDMLVICFIDEEVGYGLFARENISAGTIIGIYAGQIEEPTNEDNKFYGIRTRDVPTHRINAETYGGITRFIKHMPYSGDAVLQDLKKADKTSFLQILDGNGVFFDSDDEKFFDNKGNLLSFKEDIFSENPIYPFSIALKNTILEESIEFRTKSFLKRIEPDLAVANVRFSPLPYNDQPVIYAQTCRPVVRGEQLGACYGLAYWKKKHLTPLYFDKKGQVIPSNRYLLIKENRLLKKYKEKEDELFPTLDTALQRAAAKGRLDDVEILLEYKASINAVGTDRTFRTALHWAAFFNHKPVIDLLLNRGADKTLLDAEGKKALDYHGGK